MKKLRKGLAITLAAAMVLTMAPSNADAAKKPKLSKSTATLKEGDTLKLSVKNVKKSVKVTWKSSTKAVKVAKKTTKGTAANKVSAVKKGKAVVSASLKVGKKKYVLKCKVTVNAKNAVATATPTAAATATATATVAPQATATATVVPGTPTAKPTKKPTGTPKPTPAPTPTPMPEGNDNDFASVASDAAIRLDNSTYVTNDGCGTGRYDEKLDRIEINDVSAEALSQGSWVLPENVTIVDGDVVSFRVQGYFLGTETFRFWIGSPTSGGCTPVALVNQVDEEANAGVREDIGYPCELDADGNVLTPANRGDVTDKITANQIALNADKDKNGAFDVEFKLKAGTSQFDTSSAENPFSHFTLKGIHGSYINGLVIKNVYIMDINGKPVAGGEDDGKEEDNKEETPYTNIELKAENYDKGAATNATEADGTVKFEGTFPGVFIKLPEVLKAGESLELSLEFESEGSKPRMYGVNGVADARSTADDTIVGPATSNAGTLKGKITATADTDYVFIKKGAYNDPDFSSLTIKSFGIRKVEK